MSPGDTFAMVASTILEEVGNAIGCPPRFVSSRQLELANELKIDLTDCNSSSRAFVRIREEIQLANLDAVRRMELKPGDRVVKAGGRAQERLEQLLGRRWESVAKHFHRELEVSSIREDGQVYFKGSNGQAPARYLDRCPTPNNQVDGWLRRLDR